MNPANAVLRALYWLVVGGLVGMGVIALLSIGLFLLLASVPLFVLGAVRGWWRELWAGIVGFGLAPMVMLLIDLQGADAIQPAATAETYQLMALVFGAIAAVGIIVGIVVEVLIAVYHARAR